MHGSGNTPPVRNDGVVITMRVLFPLCAVFSCGMLSCVPLFRVAILRGRWFDWVAAWASIPVAIAAFAVVGALPEGDVRTDIALSFVLLLGAATAGYFLTFDIRHYARLQATGGGSHAGTGPRAPYGPYVQQTQAAPAQYGYPNPYASTPVVNPAPTPLPQQPPHPHPHAHPHLHQTPYEPQSQPQPQTQRQPQQNPQRMEQVRAELDELSDLLRKDQRGDQDR
ncbi:hypothetical protein [Streptomyces sp. ISL-100]|uniref:hypothetical protein n=1 Tax=Streptomyces sp. ISL-100 TaxID=2819173 RepID=UPI001BE93521|nr:hypothetical protein [Streptomyces sp. ISL-100]MBT2398408.1 hypothetical protein [Streptomyces sp. ISL-100]